jgi:hypothetical protein
MDEVRVDPVSTSAAEREYNLAGSGWRRWPCDWAFTAESGNFFAAVILISSKSFRVGDDVEAAGTAGVVKHFRLFSTTVHTPNKCLAELYASGITPLFPAGFANLQ